MQTKYLTFCDQHLAQAGQLIREGQLVAFPTETVYGLGANAWDEQAVLSTFQAKGRPSDNPLIVHIWDKGQIPQIARSICDMAQKVIDQLMPAPLTIVLPKQPTISNVITAGLDTVAIRMPMSKQARDFLQACQVPVTAPSANTSSRPSPTNWQRVAEDMDGKIAAVLCGDACQVGIESTVLDLSTDTPRILRPGMVSPQQIAAVIGQPVQVITNPKDKVNSPGVRYKHYAPKVPMALNLDGDKQKIADFYNQLVALGHNPVLLVADTNQYPGFNCHPIGKTNQQVAHNLFENLRLLENKYTYIIASFVGTGPLADSILNRLTKSAGNNIL
ncbi:MAG: threonylcarbamoyl-AMP synthase [Clostridia bacterium]|nr:threonylcarbamoyl-AMP synthase [Clostridia bacterium]